jgi:hypothetical protein
MVIEILNVQNFFNFFEPHNNCGVIILNVINDQMPYLPVAVMINMYTFIRRPSMPSCNKKIQLHKATEATIPPVKIITHSYIQYNVI